MKEVILNAKRTFLLALVMITHTCAGPSVSQAYTQEDTMGELTEGQWAEGRAFDPFGPRPIQLWLPEGTLIYNISESDVGGGSNWKYRFATTYHGYPVNLLLQPKKGVWKYRRLDASERPAKFRLTQSVFCPGETSPIVWPRTDCLYGPASGEGWTFAFAPEPSETSPKRYDVTAIPDQKTLTELGSRDEIYQFKMYEKDMDFFEKMGVLFRLDRSHPLEEFEFLGYNYFPCNTQNSFEVKKDDLETKFVQASGQAEIGFWNWFKATVKGGVSLEGKEEKIEISRTQVESSVSSIFQQWGLMRRHQGNSIQVIPFFVEKKFECQRGAGTTDPGSKIISVVVKFWNSDEDRDDVFEFNQSSDWVKVEDKLYDYIQRPVFICINNSGEQAAVVQKILGEKKGLDYNQAIFIFAQLNNGCSGTDRENCDKEVSVP